MPVRNRFKFNDTKALFEGRHPKRFRNVATVAQRKLQMLDNAEALRDLLAPPGHRLES